MRRQAILILVVCAVVAVPTARAATNFVARDDCMDRGGAWFGTIGCVSEMPQVDRIVVDKSQRRLRAYSKGALVRTMPVSLGGSPKGAKQREGDAKTPEGVYPVTEHKADSAYNLALRIGYPTSAQVAAAQEQGVNPGSDIMIHGIRNGLGWLETLQRRADWTQGCIALTNGEIEWLFRTTTENALVEIKP